ncbi:protein halfway-like [Cotesia glomerata]|uniref:protein halfway-like n=1 Tax=Cotesia glomerata TaxID=32391 RepID=UPI001D02EB72|nr:protein halfway-like [Cotesia glomerata]
MSNLFSIIFLLNILIKVNLQKLEDRNSTVYPLSSSKCFHRESFDCPQVENPNNCPCKAIKFSSDEIDQKIGVYCCNLNSETLISSVECANFSVNITDVHIRNATIKSFNVSEAIWKNLESLSITDGRINNIKGQFNNDTKISCLNLSNNALSKFNSNFIAQMNYLENLDLSFNNITDLPTFSRSLTILDISGMSTIPCLEIKQAIDRNESYTRRLSFRNKNTTVCSAAKDWTWFKAAEKISIRQLLSDISECPKGENWRCKCTFNHVLKVTPGYPTFNVDCSNNNLTELPKKLPPYTINLVVSHNKIKKLDDIVTNPSYKYLMNFNADYNEISSINILEGSRFVDNFDFFSLRFNKLKSIPIHVLVPVTYKASNEVNGNVFLGGNEILCDCYAAKYLKDWFEVNILDGDEVNCSNSLDRVINLDVMKMCKFDDESSDYIYCIIAIEVILLVTILSKLLFDYWYYKKNRKLPWFSRIMPKTRFDWFFEFYL